MTRENFVDDFTTDLKTNWTIENHTFENNLAYFSAKNVAIKNDELVLSLKKEKIHKKEYSAAEIRSKKEYLYGRFEARIKATDALGCITAFFLYQADEENQEIDFEISGKSPNEITLNNWIDKTSHDKLIRLNFNTTKEFHDYAIIWSPNEIKWEIDGKIVHSTTTAIPNKAMQVVFNLWVTKSVNWGGKIEEATLPAKAYIDKVHFYPYIN
ncbi:glycoside hydrolase family 16 protein [Pedobacter boryungensis]|uniref:Beta-glucanase n=1 Tax=Pedobacter boryungensis TaxID=869962 RepID=A0ABX2DEI4_9SPHI|nr:family 16 glycosylhydrolase [Pedobacter boryungensis]NQX31853.1 family 16 glycosylhydrolase [Pedobacter boryungensis]